MSRKSKQGKNEKHSSSAGGEHQVQRQARHAHTTQDAKEQKVPAPANAQALGALGLLGDTRPDIIKKLARGGVQFQISERFKFDGHTMAIPIPQLRSTTAEVVNHGTSNPDMQVARFLTLRAQASTSRILWVNSLIALNAARKSGNPFAIIQKKREFQAALDDYKKHLINMADNGIWNCMEYADFAAICVIETILLDRYININLKWNLHVSSLNNQNVPEEAYYSLFRTTANAQQINAMADEGRNHDHAFVTITDINNNPPPVAVIDLWRSLIDGHEAFAGRTSDFIQLLNRNTDENYVRPNHGAIRPRDIQVDINMMDLSNQMLGAHDPLLFEEGYAPVV